MGAHAEVAVPPCTGAGAGTPLHQGGQVARGADLAGRVDHPAALIRNGGRDPRAEARAGKLADEAFAIRWALRQVAPETECVRQTLDALHGTGFTTRSRP